jgi:hypothetical protein
MKEYNAKNIEVSSNSDDIEGIDMTIDAKNMGFVFDIMFSQMYRDPIGSIIREITSNCFDSHIEAKVNDAVVIEIAEDDGGDYISFTDVGIGISPERMLNIYSKPATSTKRDTNDQIGFWGLGSKSPLAYQDFFHLTTVFNNTKYEYVVHKGERGPRIDKIDEQPTTERNGSIVKIYIKNYTDKVTFKRRIKEQLRYFDNVFVKGVDFNNHYKIYIGEHFKCRNDVGNDVNLHIAIGKVCYPIDWGKIDRRKIKTSYQDKYNLPIGLPFALKFDIGDLPVTPERESIRYITIEKEDGTTVDTADLVIDKINAMLTEIQELSDSHNPILCNNVIDYEREVDTSPIYINLVDTQINVTSYVVPKQVIYTPFEHLPLSFKNVTKMAPFAEYKVTKEMYLYGPLKTIKTSVGISIADVSSRFIVRENNPSSKLKEILKDYIRYLAKQQKKSMIYFVKYTPAARWRWKNISFLPNRKIDYNRYNKLKVFKYVRAAFQSELTAFSIDIDDIVIPDDFKQQWLATHKVKVEADEDEIKVKTFYSSEDKLVALDWIKKSSGIVIYGFAKDEKKLRSWHNLLNSLYGANRIEFDVYTIRQRDERKLIALRNTIEVNAFMNDHPIFRKIATALLIARSPIWKKYNFTHDFASSAVETRQKWLYTIGRIFTPLADKVIALHRAKQFKRGTVEDEKDLVNEIIDIAISNSWFDPVLKADIEKVERYFEGLELLKYVTVTEESLPLIIEFLKLKNKPTNKEWEGLEPWQAELCIDTLDKYKYWKTLSADTASPGGSYVRRSSMEESRERYKDRLKLFEKAHTELFTILNNHQNYGKRRVNDKATASST